jgi:hypothetical protein
MGRPRGIVHDKNTRDKIQAAMIINRLYGCVMGEVELSPQQVNAAKALLNKVLPDLQSVQMDASVDGRFDIRRVNVRGVGDNTRDA